MTEFVVGVICGLINYWVGFYFGLKRGRAESKKTRIVIVKCSGKSGEAE